MANEMFTQLPTVASSQLTDIICAVQGGISVQETLEQVLSLNFQFDTLTYPGDPNGFVAGLLYQRLWDTSNKVLWVCTLAGSISTSVWETTFGTMTDGQLVIGYTNNAPQRAQLIAGANVSIVNGPGTITINSSAVAVFGWTVVSGTSQSMAANTGYIANNAAQVSLSLPTTSAVGDELGVVGKGAGGWIITQGAGQSIQVGQVASTVGAGGSVSSSANFNSIRLVCTVANTTWETWGAPQGSLNVI